MDDYLSRKFWIGPFDHIEKRATCRQVAASVSPVNHEKYFTHNAQIVLGLFFQMGGSAAINLLEIWSAIFNKYVPQRGDFSLKGFLEF
ncbi:MAG: hypothetical protein B7X55_12515 [Rhodobacterales bacterium 34-62-10]|nr:MAG: hypothetical protein B7X55_12515 [Rhodobacterales bacterium 34-62-10]